VPKLWRETIGEHREQVRDAILDAVEDLVAAHGPLSLTMSQVAEAAGIGRATLYKYFGDVESIVVAWHERHVRAHLERMRRIAQGPGDPFVLLESVLEDFAAGMSRSGHGDVGAALHRETGMADAQRRLTDLLEQLIADAARDGRVRSDVPPRDLATYCVHALAASRHLRRPAAVRRLVAVTIDGLVGQRSAQ
jgi:AcrR family transcriptional regulator